MLSLSRGLRLALVLAMSLGYVGWHAQPAFADDEEEEEDEDEGGGDEDDEGGGDEDEEDEEGEEEDPKDQPPVTAGGLFTLQTYPIRELLRPLTMTEGIVELRLGLGTDISDKGAFESYGVSLEGIYGLKDNFSLIGGFTSAYNLQQFGLYGGFEGAIAYDLVDIRLAARVGRTAANVSTDTGKVDYQGGATKFSVDLGFPFRYVARPEIAIIALDTLISFDFNGDEQEFDDGMGNTIKTGNGVKPDLNPSLGISTNPIAALSVVLFAQLQIVDFDTTNRFTVPATARIQFTPNQKFDIGMEFTFLNMKPPEGVAFYDNRFLTLYIQSRLGR